MHFLGINKGQKRPDKNRPSTKISNKLGVFYLLVLLAFVGLGFRLVSIVKENNNEYQRRILSQYTYGSNTLMSKRGDIVDCNGTILATSIEQYNLVLDIKALLEADESLDAKAYGTYTLNTVGAISDFFEVDSAFINERIKDFPNSRYFVIKKGISPEDKLRFMSYMTAPEDRDDANTLYNPYVTAVWFEKYYVRNYPQGSAACDVLGFSRSDNDAVYGLEEYYNTELTGTNGRQYGFLNNESDLEYSTIPAVDGSTIVSTIDINLQKIVEKYLKQFCEEYKDNAREGLGANNIGCIIMDANNAQILAMGSYPQFDPNNPSDLSNIYTQEQIDKIVEEGKLQETCDRLWRNYCISDTYEPGSVMKPFTVAMGLETGKVTGNETYECNGYLEFDDYKVYCHNRNGDGVLSVEDAVAQSCNVSLMKMVKVIGKLTFLDFQNVFNLGLKTNIDLAGEARTDSLVFNEDTLGETELATASFGQGFNTTMIQMCAGYAALVNGGYYYEPHIVSKILSSGGAVSKNIEPRLIKQVISHSTSEKIVKYCNSVVTAQKGTGWRAKPAGYSIGGKTGTAETLPRGNGEYVVSFIAHAPSVNPQIICYVVIDRPNVEVQEDAKYATIVSRQILTEALPYLGIPMTEDLSESEMQELMDLELSVYTNRVEKEDEEAELTEETQEPENDESGEQ